MANRQVEIENQAMKNILISMRNLGGVATRKEIRCSKLNRYCLRKEKRVMKFIQYSLAGRIIEEAEFSGASFDAYPIGQKVRITTCDEKIYVGFWGTFMEKNQVPQEITLTHYELDEKNFGSTSPDKIIVPLKKITKIEAILYSNPRWGGPLINDFCFSSDFKFNLDPDLLKNWLKK